jgi:hypothetical protein
MRAPQLIYVSGLLTKKVSGVDAVILFIKGSRSPNRITDA